MQNQQIQCKKVALKPKIRIKCIRQIVDQNQNANTQQKTKGIIRIPKSCMQKLDIEEMLKTNPIPCGSNQHILLNINNIDSRKLCQNINKQPFCSIGLLYVEFTKQFAGYGTAFLIRQNIILTAAHNIYNRVARKQAKRSTFVIDINGNKKKILQAVCAYYPRQFKQKISQDEARQFDFAILILQTTEEFKKQAKILNLSSEMSANDVISIYGYPADLSQKMFTQECIKFGRGLIDKVPQQKYMFGCQNIIARLTKRCIFHLADTSVGQSGSPILRLNQKKTEYEAVGIHTTGIFQENSGVKITREVTDRIEKWIETFWRCQDSQQQIKLVDQNGFQIIPVKSIWLQNNRPIRVSITPDTNTVAWTRKKCYQLDKLNSKICICIKQSQFEWLCSRQALPSYDQFVFSIKVSQNSVWENRSAIRIGVMESARKQKIQQQNWNNVVCLSINHQQIVRPNKQQTKWSALKCPSLPYLQSLTSIIQVQVNRQQNTIMWTYNGKPQASSLMPQSWKNQRRTLCAVARIWWQGDKVEFM